MWVRTLQPLQSATETIPANSRIEVDDHIGRLLVRRGKAERITVLYGPVLDEAAMAAVLTPDQAAQKSVEK